MTNSDILSTEALKPEAGVEQLSDPAQIELLPEDTTVLHLTKPDLTRPETIAAILDRFKCLSVVTGTLRLIGSIPEAALSLLEEHHVQAVPDFKRRPDSDFMKEVWDKLFEDEALSRTYYEMLNYGVPEAVTAEATRQRPGANYHQIAEILGVPYSTVSHRMIVFRHWLGFHLEIFQLQSGSSEIDQRAMYLLRKLELYKQFHRYIVGDTRPPSGLPAARRHCWAELMRVIIKQPNDWTKNLTEHELYAIVTYFHLNPDHEAPNTLRDLAEILTTEGGEPVSIAQVKRLRNLGLHKLGIQFQQVDPKQE